MFLQLLLLLMLLGEVSGESCDLAEDVLFCEGCQKLPDKIEPQVKTIILDDAMLDAEIDKLKGLTSDIRIIVWGFAHCDSICEDNTRKLWINQCQCQVRTTF